MTDNKKIVFTTSWDDGHELDFRVLEMLSQYRLAGTFYIPKNYNKRSLTDQAIRKIAEKQEIGAHSLNHLDLTKVSLAKAREEIFASKKYLEELLEKEVKVFCYPKGNYNSKIKKLVKQAGFLGARTAKEWHFEIASDFFEMPGSLHIYPFPFRPLSSIRQYKNPKNFLAPLFRQCPYVLKYRLGIKPFFSWPALARASFLYAEKHGKVFHLFGHSWEIEKYNMWKDLEKFFKLVSRQENIVFLTNSEVYENYIK